MKNVDTEKLFNCFNDAQPGVPASAIQRQAASNLFALGCYVHQQGETNAGVRACKYAFALLKEGDSTLSEAVLSTLEGNEAEYADWCHASLEIKRLFNKQT